MNHELLPLAVVDINYQHYYYVHVECDWFIKMEDDYGMYNFFFIFAVFFTVY
jgi:hypothetical protein